VSFKAKGQVQDVKKANAHCEEPEQQQAGYQTYNRQRRSSVRSMKIPGVLFQLAFGLPYVP